MTKARSRVLVTRRLPGRALARLAQFADVWCNNDNRPMPREELLQAIQRAAGLVCLLHDNIDREVMLQAGPGLKVIGNYAVGYDNIDIEAASELGIVVCHTPDVLTETTADLTVGLLLACARRLVEGDAMMRARRFAGFAPELLLGVDVYGKTIGIAGMGRIGRAVAHRAAGFSMKVLYHDQRRLDSGLEKRLQATPVDKPTLLRESDFLTLHLPLSEQTYRWLGPSEFQQMKKGAFLINTSRGPIVDEAALVQALREGDLGGAGLDVYEEEPRFHHGLLPLRNVVLAPHLGSATIETRSKMADLAVDGVVAVLTGSRPRHVVNQEVLTRTLAAGRNGVRNRKGIETD